MDDLACCLCKIFMYNEIDLPFRHVMTVTIAPCVNYRCYLNMICAVP